MAVYSNLAGSGDQSLTSGTARLLVDVTQFPTQPQVGEARPTNYFHLGLLRVGVQGSYAPVVPIDAASLFIDLPRGATTISYSLFHNTVIRVTEVSGTSITSPSPVSLHGTQSVATGSNALVLASYTVPANRTARLDVVMMAIAGAVAITAFGQININLGPIGFAYSDAAKNVGQLVQTYIPNELLLFAGDKLDMLATNTSGAAVSIAWHVRGVEFDSLAWSPN